MLWVVYGILTAIFYGAYSLWAKRLTKTIDPDTIAIGSILVSCILTIPFLFIFKDQIILNLQSFIGLSGIGIIVAVTRHLYMKALQRGEVSKTVPLLALSPVITVPFAFLIVGELPKIIGLFGILVAMAGVYVMNLSHFTTRDVIRPFKAIVRNEASRLMLIVTILFGFGAVLDKYIIVHSNAPTRIMLGWFFSLFFMIGYSMLKRHSLTKSFSIMRKNYKAIGAVAVLNYLVILFQMLGVALALTAYIITFKRASALFTVIGAFFIFHEKKDFKNTLTGTILLVVGVVLLTV